MENNTQNQNNDIADAIVVCENSRGVEIRATLLRLSRHQISFEIYSASDIVQMSEVLKNLNVLVREQQIYSGRAVVTGLVNAGPVAICQANLQDSWLEMDVLNLAKQPGNLPRAFEDLIQGWQKVYKIGPEFKIVTADIQSFLLELRHWVEEVELGLSGSGKGSRADLDREAVAQLIKPVTPCLNHLFEKFELISASIDKEAQATHGLYVRRQLHPLLLCAPFMHRIYRKPLGYAGDYEMVNMMLRDPNEGSSLLAKLLNSWFLSQPPAEAHRNRIKYLKERLTEESGRGARRGTPIRIMNLGCGPAGEVQEFLAQNGASAFANFTLLDFNEETIQYTARALDEVKKRVGSRTPIQIQKKSVHHVLKEGSRPVVDGGEKKYDMIYCAGLFDYLSDRTCKQLLNIFYDRLAAGGLLLATNVDSCNPIRNIMGYIFEWRLLERNAAQMRAMTPDGACPDDCKLTSDSTGCNIFLEVRKPDSTS